VDAIEAPPAEENGSRHTNGAYDRTLPRSRGSNGAHDGAARHTNGGPPPAFSLPEFVLPRRGR
jgi:hypothetical protein